MKLSNTSKMPCKSWSMNAIDTCPGSKNPDGTLVPACNGCYATTGFYQMASVRAPRIFNKVDWKRAAWVDDMVEAIGNDQYFRWFDSGDMYSLALGAKIIAVMKRTPDTMHWLPTRMYKFAKFNALIKDMNKLDNVVVRFSSDGINGEIVDGDYTSTITPESRHPSKYVVTCLAYERSGKCGTCRLCWDKDISTIAYVQHGRKMAKVHIELHG